MTNEGSARTKIDSPTILQSFIFFSPSDGAALNAKSFRARAGMPRQKLKHFNCHLMERVSESSCATLAAVLNLRWQTSC